MINEIDITKVYHVDEYDYINYTQLNYDQKVKILSWENRPEVRQWMFNKTSIQLDDHIAFIEKLKVRNDAYYWLVLKNGEPVGCYCITNISYENETGENGITFVKTGFCDLQLNWELFVNIVKFTFYLGFKEILGHTNKNNKYVVMMNSCIGYSDKSMPEDSYTDHCLTKECFEENLKKGLSYKDFRAYSKEYIKNK